MNNLNQCFDAVIAAIVPLTESEQQIAKLLCCIGDNPTDIVATIKYSRWLRFMRELVELLDRPLTTDEEAQAKKLFEEGKSPKEAKAIIAPPQEQPPLKKPKM